MESKNHIRPKREALKNAKLKTNMIIEYESPESKRKKVSRLQSCSQNTMIYFK